MTGQPNIILVSNDIVPGCGLPVAAPGLRVYGLACGLKEHGYRVKVVIIRGPLERQWRAAIPPALPPDAVLLRARELGAYLTTHGPAVVVLTNANQVDHLPDADDNRYVIDFFAPKLLETVYEVGSEESYPVDELQMLRERKLRAIERASGFIVNGRKKLPYFLAWLLQSDRDVRSLPFEHVGMCLPAGFDDQGPTAVTRPVRFAVAGYLQGWSLPGDWLRTLPPYLESGRCTLDAMLPEHWGGLSGFANRELNQLVEAHAIRVRHATTFDQYRAFLAGCDVVLDLFERTPERELAVVTRTITALCAGKPVVHPPFTEVSPLIERYGAGWLVDPADEGAVAGVLSEIVEDPDSIGARQAGARTLWRAELDPAIAVSGLIAVIEQIAGSQAAATG
jgi:glycosyltransferase involved in cell wall biosynthesis